MVKDITIPDIGEKVESGQVVGILVAVGDTVQLEQGIVEFETDKAMVEIPSPFAGRIVEISVSVGDTVKVGHVIARIETEPQAAQSAPAPEQPKQEAAPAPRPEPKPEPPPQPKPETKSQPAPQPSAPAPRPAASAPTVSDDMIAASPSVRRLAREMGVDIREVAASLGGERITAEDVKRHVKGAFAGATPTPPPMVTPRGEMPDFSEWGEVETVQASQVRHLIAESTTTSWRTIPHVTQYDEADVTSLEEFLKSKAKVAEKAGAKLTVSAVLLKILAAALQKFPMFNSSYDLANRVIYVKKYYHLGVAVDTSRGLLVPVIRDVDQKSIITIARELTEIAQRAREKRISPDEMAGGTFTLSNQGAIGGTNFTPLVYWPQVAILGVSRTATKPVFIEGDFEARRMLPLSLSYDHRVVDGADAVRFVRWIAEALENPLSMVLDD